MFIGDHGQGVLNISSGGVFDASGGVIALGWSSDGAGTVDIGAGGSLLAFGGGVIGGTVLVGSDGTGSLTIEQGGSLTASGVTVGGGAGVGTALIDGQATVSQLLRIANGKTTVATGGDVTVGVGGKVVIAKGGTLNVRTGSIEIGQVASGQTGVVTVGKGGTLVGGGTIQGKILTLGGKVSVGDPQTLTVEGDYQQVSGVLDFQLAGPDDYDQLIVKGGGVDIEGGIVELDFIDGFAPRAGDDFQLISADDGITFDPNSIELNGLASGFQWRFSYDPNVGAYDLIALNDATLGNPTAAPEPATWAMMLVGLGGLSMLRTVRRKTA